MWDSVCRGDTAMRLYEVIEEMRAAREERSVGTPTLSQEPRREQEPEK